MGILFGYGYDRDPNYIGDIQREYHPEQVKQEVYTPREVQSYNDKFVEENEYVVDPMTQKKTEMHRSGGSKRYTGNRGMHLDYLTPQQQRDFFRGYDAEYMPGSTEYEDLNWESPESDKRAYTRSGAMGPNAYCRSMTSKEACQNERARANGCVYRDETCYGPYGTGMRYRRSGERPRVVQANLSRKR